MRPSKPISDKAKDVLKGLLRQAGTKGDFQRVQCVWLRARLGLNSTEISEAVGWTPERVKVVQHQYFKGGEETLIGGGRGGRRRENLSIQAEDRLLECFLAKANAGEVLVVTEVKTAYETAVGHPVPKSTVYRMLKRHGWRKIAPRPRHPKTDPQAAEAFKKNSPKSSPRKTAAKAIRGKPFV